MRYATKMLQKFKFMMNVNYFKKISVACHIPQIVVLTTTKDTNDFKYIKNILFLCWPLLIKIRSIKILMNVETAEINNLLLE